MACKLIPLLFDAYPVCGFWARWVHYLWLVVASITNLLAFIYGLRGWTCDIDTILWVCVTWQGGGAYQCESGFMFLLHLPRSSARASIENISKFWIWQTTHARTTFPSSYKLLITSTASISSRCEWLLFLLSGLWMWVWLLDPEATAMRACLNQIAECICGNRTGPWHNSTSNFPCQRLHFLRITNHMRASSLCEHTFPRVR